MLTVTKRFQFCYAHKLYDYRGKCNRTHGHNADLEVEFERPPRVSSYLGMVLDFATIKEHVGPIVELLDHSFLNDDFPDIRPPVVEMMINWIKEKIQETPIGSGLVRLRLSEGPNSWGEWKR